MTAIFGTPLAAILLALEVLLFEWKPRSFVPVLVAVLVAMGCRPLLIGARPIFPLAVALPALQSALGIADVPGVAVGRDATLLSNPLYRIEDLDHRLHVHVRRWMPPGALRAGLGGGDHRQAPCAG